MSEQRQIVEPVDLPIVFILGKGRSGTTLLQTMLDAHPNTIAPIESRFVVHFKNRYGQVTKWTSDRKSALIQDVLEEQKIKFFWEIDVQALMERINQLPEDTSYVNLCEQVFGSAISFFPKETPKIIIDKNPIYAMLTPHILDVFPNARFIHMVRDYRASSSSVLRLSNKMQARQLGFRWLVSNQEIEKLKAKLPERFQTLRYEDLLQQPEIELKKLTSFLGIDYHLDMLKFHENIQAHFGEYLERSPSAEIKKLRELGSTTVHKNLSKPLDPSFIDKWKTTLSDKEIEDLELVCGEFGKRYQYETKIDNGTIPSLSFGAKIHRDKLRLYYRLPIRLRELKSKPNLAYLETNG